MKYALITLTLFGALSFSCLNGTKPSAEKKISEQSNSSINESGNSIESRFICPAGFKRVLAEPSSFSSYLRDLPLKKYGSPVALFDGSLKSNQQTHLSVIDLAIGKRDLHQCADAVMRLRAEYLFNSGQFEKIHFNFTNGFRADFSTWKAGNRISVSGNSVKWKPSTSSNGTSESFWKYLEMVFTYAGTASLDKELPSKPILEMRAGDLLIQGGFPGHAVIVIDMCENETTGEKMYMLAQSYMPAQEIHVLKNPSEDELTVWFELNENETIRTPERTFTKNDLKSF